MRIRVLFIVGAGRSGSTLLGRILGEVPGFVNIGEAASFLFRKVHHQFPCSCGKPVRDCEFWKPIFLPLMPQVEKWTQGWRIDLGRHRMYPRIMFRKKGLFIREFNEFSFLLYQSIRDQTRADVIVDTSKTPNFPLMLLSAVNPKLDVYVLHLVRDPRGFVSSRIRPKSYLVALKPDRAIMVWNVCNLTALLLKRFAGKYMRLRYEDFTSSPMEITMNIVRWVSGEQKPLPFQGNKVTIGTQHVLAGNPDKFKSGQIAVHESTWKLPRCIRLATEILTFPLALILGYKFWGKK
ncbi:MAG: sulfotransferase [Methanobacteriota archaeon]|nr:MAG: sulfotransferase [Euryarchaeota archaeon]